MRCLYELGNNAHPCTRVRAHALCACKCLHLERVGGWAAILRLLFILHLPKLPRNCLAGYTGVQADTGLRKAYRLDHSKLRLLASRLAGRR